MAHDQQPIPPHRGHKDQATQTPVVRPGIFEGVVVGNMLPNNLTQVEIIGLKRPVNCVWAAGIVSGLLGFKTSYIPTIKTKVLVYYTGQDISFIIGSTPTTMFDTALPFRSMTDPDAPDFGDSEVYKARRKGPIRMMASHKPPLDLAEGELVIDNLMGVGIALLRNLAMLSAGDMAKVECHLMDDMVRIISGTFRHHSALGDTKIYNDGGRLNLEFNGTLYDYEAYGNPDPAQPRAKMDNPDKVNLGRDSEIDGYTDDGRWRMSQYVGWLGDFINMWVTDPVQTLGRLASDQLRAGKFRYHVNSDGSCLVQSVSEIALEKVVRIPVPIRKRREDDPEGNRSDSAIRNSAPLRNWKPSGDNLFEMAFQLREYSRWLSNTWSMARFKQMDLDFKVPTEAETPAPNPNSVQSDKFAQNHDEEQNDAGSWTEAYACIRILRDGSTMIVDGYGNSILTTESGVQISSTQDIYLEAAGSVNIVAGRDINLVARKNVGITAVQEAVRIKSEQALQMLSKIGKVVMDFITPGWLVLKNGSVTANGMVSLNGQIGTVDAISSITGMMIQASVTRVADGHDGHIFSGSPAPEPATESFSFQSDYASPELYQTFSQSALARGEIASLADWNFSTNEVGGKGSPWPGVGPQFLKTTAGQNLSQPSAVEASPDPKPMQAVPLILKTQ